MPRPDMNLVSSPSTPLFNLLPDGIDNQDMSYEHIPTLDELLNDNIGYIYPTQQNHTITQDHIEDRTDEQNGYHNDDSSMTENEFPPYELPPTNFDDIARLVQQQSTDIANLRSEVRSMRLRMNTIESRISSQISLTLQSFSSHFEHIITTQIQALLNQSAAPDPASNNTTTISQPHTDELHNNQSDAEDTDMVLFSDEEDDDDEENEDEDEENEDEDEDEEENEDEDDENEDEVQDNSTNPPNPNTEMLESEQPPNIPSDIDDTTRNFILNNTTTYYEYLSQMNCIIRYNRNPSDIPPCFHNFSPTLFDDIECEYGVNIRIPNPRYNPNSRHRRERTSMVQKIISFMKKMNSSEVWINIQNIGWSDNRPHFSIQDGFTPGMYQKIMDTNGEYITLTRYPSAFRDNTDEYAEFKYSYWFKIDGITTNDISSVFIPENMRDSFENHTYYYTRSVNVAEDILNAIITNHPYIYSMIYYVW